MVISSAYLNTFPNRKVSRTRTATAQSFIISPRASKKPTGLVAVPVESRQNDLWFVVGCLFVVGASAGLYVTPLQALLQKLSPVDSRGQYIAASNAIDTVLEVGGIGLFFLLRNIGVGSQEIFYRRVGRRFDHGPLRGPHSTAHSPARMELRKLARQLHLFGRMGHL